MASSIQLTAPPPEATPEMTPNDDLIQSYSPDGQWQATLNRTVGSLNVYRDKGWLRTTVFTAGTLLQGQISWSPDSQHLLITRPYQPITATETSLPQQIEIWHLPLDLTTETITAPTRIFQASEVAFARDGQQRIVLAGVEGIIAVQLMDQTDQTIITLPQRQPSRW